MQTKIYYLVQLTGGEPVRAGHNAGSGELARLVPYAAVLDHRRYRYGIMQDTRGGGTHDARTLISAESHPGEWVLGGEVVDA